MRLIIGIDPGITGALALLQVGAPYGIRHIASEVMPTVKRKKGKGYTNDVDPVALLCLLNSWAGNYQIPVFMERISARPGQGVVSMFSMGNALGVVQGCLAAAGFTYTYIQPVAWKRHFNLLHSDKEASRQKAMHLFGAEHFPLKKHHGKAEACLIGAYGFTTLPREEK